MFHWYTHFLLLWSLLHGCSIHSYLMFTHHCYICSPHECTCIHGFSILVIWITVHIACQTHVFLLHDCFPLHLLIFLLLIFLLLDMRAVDMRYVESHIYCSRFPLYYSMLSTELRSCYHVTCIMYCICSCYIVYLTYQIIKLTGVWGRLDGWLDLIG